MAALLRALAGSGRNVQGTAAPVHSLWMGRRYAGRAAQSTLRGALPGHVLSSHCAPDCAAHGGALASAEAFEPTETDGLTAPRSSRMLRVGFRSID